ncbi:Zn-dependent peptidases [Thiohalobacter thiocyanaticus]|uniref:Zn-dependent peptidases n=1 Tax=Thiohalobacter thiocyanaticus TaxID=585455 RepID=A0A1Z4VUV9_9GAMM|nr:pitrilysin family protein [Thiohalobacter thiocyanaticus]BAZ95411.1 Zn-dependent peptidases [Thiohalobacter thiocyanaticus]
MRRICILLLGLCAALPAQAMEPIQHWLTDNGARVYFVPAPELPMVDIRVVFDAGSARDGGHPGLAGLTNGLLDQGAGEMDADAIAERLESVGAQLGTGARRDMAWVNLRSLSSEQHLQPALEVYRQVLAAPAFAETAFARERRRTLVGLQQMRQQPSQVAERAFYAALFGEHPYATPSEGTIESVQTLEREQLAAFHRRYYVARNAVVAIVGDLDRARAERLAASVSGGLPAGEPAPALPAVESLAAADLQRIDHPSSQSHILMGQPGMRRGDEDYFALYVGNYVLGGGGLVSRISEEVREKRGLSYSAYSYFLPMARRGPLVLGLQTRNEQADAALQVLRETLARFVAEGPTEAEMEAARKHITGGFPLRIDSNSETLEYIAMIGFYDLPLDYLQRFNDRVNAVTRADVRDAFQRRVQPERMVTVIVGEQPSE